MIEASAARIQAAKNQTPYIVENQWYSKDLNQSIDANVAPIAHIPKDERRRDQCVLLELPDVSVSKDHLRRIVEIPMNTTKIPTARAMKKEILRKGDFQI